MAPKNKGKGKDSGDSKDAGDGKSKLKPATSINVRHILCEKHSKKEEALEKIRNGAKFDEVAREMSEDKARQGMFITTRELRGHQSRILADRSCRRFSRLEGPWKSHARLREGCVRARAQHDWGTQDGRGQNERGLSHYHGRREKVERGPGGLINKWHEQMQQRCHISSSQSGVDMRLLRAIRIYALEVRLVVHGQPHVEPWILFRT